MIIIHHGKNDNLTPLFCPLCDFSICNKNDITSYRKFECCQICQELFCQGEIAQQQWKNGHRPDKEFVKSRYKSMGLIR